MNTRPSRIHLFLTTFVVALSLSGCEFLHRNTIGLFTPQISENQRPERTFSSASQSGDEELRRATTTIGVEKLPTPSEQEKGSQIEIIWEIPKEPVDGFVIHYGFSKDHLEKVVRLKAGEIEKYEDPKFGFVYRYKLKDIPKNKSVFVALATFQGGVTSELSEVFPVTPSPGE
jgi:hypothetical protein